MIAWKRSRRAWWALAALLVLGMLGALWWLGHSVSMLLQARQEGEALVAARTIPDTDVNPYGANFFLPREVEPWKIEKTLQMAAEGGIGWVKIQVPWEQIEPERKGEFLTPQTRDSTWTKYDRLVEYCDQYGMEIVARLDRPPAWTRKDNTYAQAPPDDPQDYGDFVYAFVSRYRGRIHYIQLWNEPNIFPEWGNQPVDPEGYVALLKAGYLAAKQADPNVRVLSAPLAITLGEPHPEPGKWQAMNDLDYLEAMYQAGAADYFDIYSSNAFGLQYPPEDPPDPGVLNFQRVVLHRQIMERYGDGDKAVWFNEYGWNAAPESMSQDALVWQRVSEQQQADYTLRGIKLARQEWPWAGVFMIWYFRQVGNIAPSEAEYYFRMVDPDFTPRQIYLAVQDATQQQGEVGRGIYQEMNAAVKRYGSWRLLSDTEASGEALLYSDTPDSSVTLSYRGQGVRIVTRTGPEGGRLLVTVDGRPAPGLPRDAQGQAYLSLYTAEVDAQAELQPVLSDQPGAHTLRLTVEREPEHGGSQVYIDTFEVLAGETSQMSLAPLMGGAAALLVGALLLLLVLRRLGILPRRG
ncbi:MAG: hypothetical protein ACOX2L_07600 [Anaerolineae bacterium]|nr:hypothetical protein [Chloroflexota bacterium]